MSLYNITCPLAGPVQMADGNYVHICYQSKLQARTVSPAHTVGRGVLPVVRSGVVVGSLTDAGNEQEWEDL